jgi:dTDP-4-dehydrorhamnose reductase
MRILLTGVTGQVGHALATRLARLGTFVPVDRMRLNLAEPTALPAALDRLAPDLIVNPAAYTAVEKAEEEPEVAFAVNAEAPSAMACWASQRGIPMLHFSTDYVFDGADEKPWNEDSPTGPLSVYGQSKLAGEEAVRNAGGVHLIVRTSWVYSARGANFLRTMARQARERSELRVVADQIGAPTSARIIADTVAALLAADPDTLRERFVAARGVVNIATSGETSWHGFATCIIDGLRERDIPLAVQAVVPLRSDEYPTKARRPRNSRLALTRLQEVFGLTTPSWREALQPELDDLAKEMH